MEKSALSRHARRDDLDPREALDILESRSREAQSCLAQRTDAGDAVLQYLAEHGAPATRAAVAANAAAPALTNRLLADDDDEDVRVQLAIKIARLIPGLGSQESTHIVDLTIETLQRLADDSTTRVRAILADEIKHLVNVPHSVILALATDLEHVVAAPVLEYPLLSDADLIEIIACGQAHEALAAIARRHPLSEAVSDSLVQSLDVSAISALLVNVDARIRADTLDHIIRDAKRIEALHLPLALRVELSARAIRRIASFVGMATIEQLVARHDLDVATRTYLNRQLRLRLEKGADDPQDTASTMVARAKSLGRLNGQFIEEAALAGHRESVVLALADLAAIPPHKVHRILASGAKPLVALVWRAGLSMRTAFKIQTLVMKLPASELLPARGGVNFPLTRSEMAWHLSYFDIAL